MYLYLDESGDLGFDFKNKKPSRFFVITLLAINESKSIKIINNAVIKTLEKKLNHKKKNCRYVSELKGSATTLIIKKYFLNYIDRHSGNLSIYSIMLDKLSLLEQIQNPVKERIYNRMTHQLLEKIPFPAIKHVNLIVDRSKDNLGVKEFNEFLYTNLSLCLNLETKLYISHDSSEKHKGIQAADIFCYGIARKYEMKDESWYNLFKDKIKIECEFQI